MMGGGKKESEKERAQERTRKKKENTMKNDSKMPAITDLHFFVRFEPIIKFHQNYFSHLELHSEMTTKLCKGI